MKILLTGVTGYIGKRILPVLLDCGYDVYCCVRDKMRFDSSKYQHENLHILEVNFLKPETFSAIPKDIDAAYYLIHSMSTSTGDFTKLESESALNFKQAILATSARQVIYLGGISNDQKLSKHLSSRKNVEEILGNGTYALTTLRAGIIIGSGSASFEIMRDLVEKLPFMITPMWLNTRSQPIAVRNVIEYLVGVLLNPETYNKGFDIGGPDILTYRQMLLEFARVRGLKRYIVVTPIMTPKLSSYWLYFVTSVSYPLATRLVSSMKTEVIAYQNELNELIGVKLIDFKTAVKLAFDKIEQHQVISSWTDALTSHILDKGVRNYINIPTNGCFIDKRHMDITNTSKVEENIFSIGGDTGWYYANWLWTARGFIDKLFGGVGLRRGRKDPHEIFTGETLDFWKVLLANKQEKRLLLYAEMKLPGEAWLELKIENNTLFQTATFRPLGLGGRFYWYSVMPLHKAIFRGMLRKIGEA